MEFVNGTPYSADIFRAALEDDVIAAAAILRKWYQIGPEGIIAIDSEEFPVSMEPQMTPFGLMASDAVFRRGGADLLVFGKALSPTPTPESEVSVWYNNTEIKRIRVLGNRVWQQTPFKLAPSAPEPFVSMPIHESYAFGGQANWDGIDIPHPMNPYGKGYILEEDQAEGRTLPNVEDPDHPILYWNDQPLPTGLGCCPSDQMKMEGNVEINDQGEIIKIQPGFFNAAYPDMILKEISPGDSIRIKGMTDAPEWEFILPKDQIEVSVEVGANKGKRSMMIDQIGLFPGNSTAFITYRYPFRYTIRPKERRSCTIIESEIVFY